MKAQSYRVTLVKMEDLLGIGKEEIQFIGLWKKGQRQSAKSSYRKGCRVTHIPSGVFAECDGEDLYFLNKNLATLALYNKLLEKELKK